MPIRELKNYVQAYVQHLEENEEKFKPSTFAKLWCSKNPGDDYKTVYKACRNKAYRSGYKFEQDDDQKQLLIRYIKESKGDINQVTSFWHKTKEFSVHYSLKDTIEEFDYQGVIEDIVAKYIKTSLPEVKPTEINNRCLNVIKSDVHIGMSAEDAIFNFKWDKEEAFKRTDILLKDIAYKISKEGNYERLVIYDLGDALDGYNKQTTRGGHQLEQNMDNVEAFETHIEINVYLITQLIKMSAAKYIIVDNVGNCNHSGSFGQIANLAVKKIVEAMFGDRVKFIIRDKFISSSTWGIHTEIISHGKDKSYMRSGLPYNLSPNHINYINNYIRLAGINSKHIRVYKGDLHQLGFQQTQNFDYYNFMSFAPPNAYGQVNFMTAKSGYSLISYQKDSEDIEVVNRTFKNEINH